MSDYFYSIQMLIRKHIQERWRVYGGVNYVWSWANLPYTALEDEENQ